VVHGLAHRGGGEVGAVGVVFGKLPDGAQDGVVIDVHGIVQGLALGQGGGHRGGDLAGGASVGIEVRGDDGVTVDQHGDGDGIAAGALDRAHHGGLFQANAVGGIAPMGKARFPEAVAQVGFLLLPEDGEHLIEGFLVGFLAHGSLLLGRGGLEPHGAAHGGDHRLEGHGGRAFAGHGQVDVAVIARAGDLGVDGNAPQERHAGFLGQLFAAARAQDIVDRAAVGADEAA